MTAVECAGCTKQIEGSDIYYRLGDGAPICHLCYLGVDRVSVCEIPKQPSSPLTCAVCLTLIDGTIYHRPFDRRAVCAACYPQTLVYLDLPKARYHDSRSASKSSPSTAAQKAGGSILEALFGSFDSFDSHSDD